MHHFKSPYLKKQNKKYYVNDLSCATLVSLVPLLGIYLMQLQWRYIFVGCYTIFYELAHSLGLISHRVTLCWFPWQINKMFRKRSYRWQMKFQRICFWYFFQNQKFSRGEGCPNLLTKIEVTLLLGQNESISDTHKEYSYVLRVCPQRSRRCETTPGPDLLNVQNFTPTGF